MMHMGEYQIVVHFNVPHLIHVILSGYNDHYWYGMFSHKEDMIYLLLTHHGLFFHISNSNILLV